MLKFLIPLNSLKKIYIFTQHLYRVHKCVTCFLLSTELKTTVSIFSPENGSGSNYIETSPSFKLFGKINSFHILWSSIFVAFSTKSTVTPSTIFYSDSSFWISSEISFEKVSNEDGCEIQFRFRGVSTATKSTHGSNMKQK